MTAWRRAIQQSPLRLLESRWYWGALVTGIFIPYAIWCSRNRLAGDVGWYLYAVQRLRAGAVLYRDIQDMNPPAVYLMYLPLGWLHQVSGISIERLLDGAVAGLTGLVMILIYRIPGMSFIARGLMALSVAFAALSVDRHELGQRDPLCALLFTGLVISTYLRIQKPDQHPGWVSSIAVSAAGLGLAMKPHFLLAWLLVVAALSWHVGLRRAFRMKETWLPLLVSTFSWIVTLIAFPDYLAMIGLATRYYSNMGMSAYDFSPLLLPLLMALVAFLSRTESNIRPLILLSVLATVGFSVECIVQRKGFTYHLTPAMFWGTITAGLLFAAPFERGAPRWRPSVAAVMFSTALAAYSLWSASLPPPRVFARTQVEDFVTQYARGRTVLTLSTDMRTGFPLILEAGAINARPDAQLWTLGTLYQDQVLRSETSPPPVAAQYHSRPEMSVDERFWFDQVVDIVAVKRPAVILIQTANPKLGLGHLQFDFLDYFSTDARFREALRNYKTGPSNDQRLVLFLEDSKLAAAGSMP